LNSPLSKPSVSRNTTFVVRNQIPADEPPLGENPRMVDSLIAFTAHKDPTPGDKETCTHSNLFE
jgi:hypothetical protein